VSSQSESFDVAVVGGGPIGLACAWKAEERGARVVVIDAGEPGAWHVAAGMLAPMSEVDFGEHAQLQLGLESARRYEAFCEALEEPGYRPVGTLCVARDRDEAEALDRLAEFRRGLGLPVERLRASQARRLEPALAPTVRLALEIASDHSVDPRLLVAALRRKVTHIWDAARAIALQVEGDRVTGVITPEGTVLADKVVVATGVDSAKLGMPDAARVPIRPVKGQVLRLRDPNGPGLVERTIRGEQAYFVPRGDGRYVLGATMEERGWDVQPTAGGVYELLRDLSELVPGVFELEIEELIAGLRPATPDNLPAIGPGALDGLVWATGHFRNGILLTPVTADLVAGVLAGESLPDWAEPANPQRFAGVVA
jgi:glycine oxidase